MMNDEDQVVLEFPVLWQAWECDDLAWVMERADGTRYLRASRSTRKYEVPGSFLEERIAEYERVLELSREALSLLRSARDVNAK